MKEKTKRWSEDEKKALQFWLSSNASDAKDNYINAASYLNDMFHTNRTPDACKAMDIKINKPVRP